MSKNSLLSSTVIAAALAAGLAGCAHYHALPLTSTSVEAALTPPSHIALQEQAKRLQHPILRPLDLNMEDGISPDEAAVLAVLLNPSLRAERDRRNLAGAQVLEAKLLPNPELSFDLEEPVGGNTSEAATGFGLGLNWDVRSLITRNARMQEATEKGTAVDLDIAWQEWQVAQTAKEAVYRLLSLARQAKLVEEDQNVLDQNLETMQRAVSEGIKTTRDLAPVRAAHRQAESTLLDLRRQESEQILRLKQLMGFPSNYEFRLQEGLELPTNFSPPPAAALSKGLEERRLDLVALRHGYESQEATLRAAILNQFPKISIGPTFSRDVEDIDSIGFGVSIELPLFNRNQAKIAAEQATRQRLFDEYVSRIFESRSTIASLIDGIHYLERQISVAQAAEDDLQNLAETYNTAALSGRADSFTYYQARSDWTAARLRTIRLEEQLAEAIIALDIASGTYDSSIPSFAGTE